MSFTPSGNTLPDLHLQNSNVFHFSFHFLILTIRVPFYAHVLMFCFIYQIQKALGCKKNPLAYDITAACSGFVLGLVSAACHIRGN